MDIPPRDLAGPRAGHTAADAARHPFNLLPLLRQALACSDDGCINRFVAGALLRHVWQGGHDALDAERLRVLAEQLSEQIRPGQDMHSDGPKALLRANTEAAQAAGVFGVPAFEVDGKLFWGSMACPCCARIWRETPGSTARSGMRWRRCHQGWRQPPRVNLLLI